MYRPLSPLQRPFAMRDRCLKRHFRGPFSPLKYSTCDLSTSCLEIEVDRFYSRIRIDPLRTALPFWGRIDSSLIRRDLFDENGTAD